MSDNSSFLPTLINATIEEEKEEPFGDEMDKYDDVFVYWIPFSFVVNIFKDIILSMVIFVIESWIIYLFLKFPKLRKKLDIYIFNLCFVDAYAQIKSLIDFLLLYVFDTSLIFKHQRLYCIFIQMYKCSLPLYFTICFCLALEWFVTSYRPHLLQISQTARVAGIIFVNLIFFTLGLVASFSFNCFYNWSENLVLFFYILLSLVMVVLNVLASKTNLKKAYVHTSYAFSVSNVVFLSFLPLAGYHVLIIFLKFNFVFEILFLFTLFIPQAIAHAHFLLILFILYKQNVDVRSVLIRHFKVLDELNDDQTLTENMENETNTYVHADHFGSVEDTRRISSFV